MVAVAFACGLGLGVVVGAALWSGALYLSKLIVQASMKRETAQWRQMTIAQQKRIEKAKADLRQEYPEMTPEQDRIMEAELGKLYQDFPNPKM